MTEATKQFIREALGLPTSARIELVEELLSSLDRPDPAIERLWAQEAEDRLHAFDAGEMVATLAEDVFAEAAKILEG